MSKAVGEIEMTRALTLIFAAASLATAATAQPFPAPQSQATSFVTLGTNSGPIPNPDRAEAANLLQAAGQNILVDAGDGAAWQAAKAGASLRSIGSIFLSHLHFDHTGGLFAVISQRYQMIEPSPLTIYGPPGTKGLVDGLVSAMTEASRGANNMRGFAPGGAGDNIKVVELTDGARLTISKVTVTAVRNSHFSATKGGDDPRALSFAYRFDTPDRSIVYTGDTGPSAAIERLAKGADLLVCEIMDPEIALARIVASQPKGTAATRAMIGEHFRKEHVSPTEAGLMASRAGVKKLVLTHTALPDEAVETARQQIARSFRGETAFAKDLDRF